MQLEIAEEPRGRLAVLRPLVAATLLLVVSALALSDARAARLETLYSFCSKGACADGAVPQAPVIMDASGKLYGTTIGGGNASQEGTVYELVHHGGAWKEVVIHSFCSKADCADGAGPASPVIMDVNGNLYGTTYITGVAKEVVFELVRGARKWQFKRLYEFCSQDNCPDGVAPEGGLTYLGQSAGQLYDGFSPLFGTTFSGGAFNQGTVFEMTPPAPGTKKWHQKVIYSFCEQNGCADGAEPAAPVTADSSGNLFGTTIRGGANVAGVAFMLAPAARAGWSQTVLYNFCSMPLCADGGLPNGLILDASGTLYGTTAAGAGSQCGGGGCGTAFALSPNGSQFTVLYSFCSQHNCADGFNPTGSLAMDASGNLFGVTSNGGNTKRMDSGGGTAFELSGTTFRVLYRFCSESKCADGANPAGVILGNDGDILGTTGNGGTNVGGGTVFRLTP